MISCHILLQDRIVNLTVLCNFFNVATIITNFGIMYLPNRTKKSHRKVKAMWNNSLSAIDDR